MGLYPAQVLGKFFKYSKYLIGIVAFLNLNLAAGATRFNRENPVTTKCDESQLESPIRPLELVSTLQSSVPRLNLAEGEYGLRSLYRAAEKAVGDYAEQFGDKTSGQAGPTDDRQFQQALTAVADKLDRSRSLYNQLLGRSYRPRSSPPVGLDGEVVEQTAELAAAFAARLARSTDAADAACRSYAAELRDAAHSALITTARDRITLGVNDPLRHVRDSGLLALSGERAGACNAVQDCVLRARLELLLSETDSGRPASESLRRAREHALAAIERSAREGPSLSAAEAWMVLAELEPESDELNMAHVRNAYAMIESLRTGGVREALGGSPGSFRHRLLPIYQAAADEAYSRLAAAGPDRQARALVEVGEAARRAQIEFVLADSCEPVKVPLSPAHLRADETIIYPVIGRQRLYLLIGRSAGGLDSSWRLRVRELEGGPASVADAADRLVASLQRVNEEDVRRAPANELYDSALPLEAPPHAPAALHWRDEEARTLHRLVLEPLSTLLPERAEPSSDDAHTLIFFPDPLLRNVPWALLHGAGTDGTRSYLVRSYAIAVGPALAYVSPSAKPGHRGHLVAGGFDVVGEGLETFVSNLPYVVPNLRGHDIIVPPQPGEPGSRGATFSGESLLERLRAGEVSVLLLATHAKFEGATSSIVVPPPNRRGLDILPLAAIETSLRTGRRRAQILDLLILIACEGATGDAGELGLAGAALRGGAAGTIGSVVRVNSKAAPRYFADAGRPGFLPAYYAGLSPAQSLRVSQLAAMTSDHEVASLASEANWGTFMLIGNWR